MSKSLTFKGITKDYENYIKEKKEQEAELNKVPEKKHELTVQPREASKNKYQQIRKDDLELAKLNKMYNITKVRNNALKKN
jgi:hypothetical protein